jgi:hypothetical protein
MKPKTFLITCLCISTLSFSTQAQITCCEPTNLVDTALSASGQVKFCWNCNTSPNCLELLGFQLKIERDDMVGGPITFNIITGTCPVCTTLTGLASGELYHWKVRRKCNDGVGGSVWSEWVIGPTFTPFRLAAANNLNILPVLFPNPAESSISIAWAANNENKVSFIIKDISGKIMRSTEEIVSQSDEIHKIDVANFPSGTYFISASDGETQRSGKFIKQ